jgi:hypothetical protein
MRINRGNPSHKVVGTAVKRRDINIQFNIMLNSMGRRDWRSGCGHELVQGVVTNGGVYGVKGGK